MFPSTKRAAKVAGLCGSGILLAGFFILDNIPTRIFAWQWLLLASALWGFVWWQLWQRLPLNRADDSQQLYPSLGLANHLTLVRGGLIALTGGFLLQPQDGGIIGWVPAVLYGIAAIFDRLDGFVARRTQRTSLLGSELDTAYDALGLLIAPLLAVGYGKIHWSFLLVSVAYYIFVWGLHWRRTHQLPVYPLMPSQLRRALAGFQMGFVAVILLPCFHPPFTLAVGVAFMLPILLGFAVDWLVVSGRIGAGHSAQHFFTRLAFLSRTLFQPLLRLALCGVLLVAVRDSNPTLSTSLLSSLLIGSVLVILGIAGRIGALAILALIGLIQGTQSIDALTGTIIFSSAWLTLLGTGRFSLWQGDDHWVNRRDGEGHHDNDEKHHG